MRMTLEDIKDLVASTELPYAYNAFPIKTDNPKIVFYVDETSTLSANNRVGETATRVEIDLYTNKKEPETEAILEEALADLYYTKAESFIDDERCLRTEYRVSI